MKLTNQQIVQSLNGLVELSETDMPIQLAFSLNRINAGLAEAYSVYEQTLRKAGKNQAEIEKLLACETEVDITPVPKQVLLEAGLTIKPRTLIMIDPVLEG